MNPWSESDAEWEARRNGGAQCVSSRRLASVFLTRRISPPLPFLAQGVGEYGKVRLWGAVGWGVSAMICGEILETVGLPGNVAFFCLSAACSLALLPLLNYAAVWDEKKPAVDADELELASLNPSRSEEAAEPRAVPTRTALQALCDVDVIMVLLAALVMGYAVGHIENFLFIYLDGLGACEPLGVAKGLIGRTGATEEPVSSGDVGVRVRAKSGRG